MQNETYVLILAGGSGERFWPLSRKSRPKQLLSFFGDKTLLEETLARLEGLVPLQNVLVLTNQDQEKAVRELLPQLPAPNIVAEPAKRDTAPAIALGVAWVALRNPQATMIVLPSDHLIRDREAFQANLRLGVKAARQSGALVTIGIKPTWACPGFGYIETGAALPGGGAFEVVRFREKPDAQTALEFVKQGNFRWNAGMFIWALPSVREVFTKHAPELALFVDRVQQKGELAGPLRDQFPGLPKISIDFAVMEKAGRVAMVEAAFDWDDVGGWPALAKYLPKTPGGNASNAELSELNAKHNIVYSDGTRRIALVGVDDLLVVQTADALLICKREEAEKIKNLLGQLPPELH